jgi:uncharacterized protein
MTETRSVLWHNPHDDSTELCRLIPASAGWALEGLVLLPVEGEPVRVDYRVEADQEWNTHSVQLRVREPTRERELELSTSGRHWRVNGATQPSLEGCTDVDLRVTPATNTLPIRRLALDIGAQAPIRAAWIGFPDLQVSPSEQTYQRRADRTYRYRSNGFVADLHVDDAGLVVRYADEYWRAIAAR